MGDHQRSHATFQYKIGQYHTSVIPPHLVPEKELAAPETSVELLNPFCHQFAVCQPTVLLEPSVGLAFDGDVHVTDDPTCPSPAFIADLLHRGRKITLPLETAVWIAALGERPRSLDVLRGTTRGAAGGPSRARARLLRVGVVDDLYLSVIIVHPTSRWDADSYALSRCESTPLLNVLVGVSAMIRGCVRLTNLRHRNRSVSYTHL